MVTITLDTINILNSSCFIGIKKYNGILNIISLLSLFCEYICSIILYDKYINI